MSINDFAHEINRQHPDLPRAALLYARSIAYPDLDIAGYLLHLDEIAQAARETVFPGDPPILQAELLSEFLFHHLSFQGNALEYDDPRNSFLNQVLERRLGIPITLSLVFVAVAERLGLAAHGIGLPGHFIVGVPLPAEILYLDPFHSGAHLTRSDCIELVQRSTGFQGDFQDRWLQPAAPHEILARMLNNLRLVYLGRNDWTHAIRVIEHLRVVQPAESGHLRDLGLLHQRQGALRKAIEYFEKYLRRSPDAADAGEITAQLQRAVQVQGRLN